MLKTAVAAAMPSASVRTAVAVKLGFFLNVRNAKRTSRNVSVGGWHARLDHALLHHREMEFQLFVRTSVDFFAAEQSSQARAYVNPPLFDHHVFKGSIARLTASTKRRHFEISTVICLRPRGVNL
jgi:hypothetical protein